MPHNRLEELASLYMADALPKEFEDEFLNLLATSEAQALLADNLYLDRLLRAIRTNTVVNGQVIKILENSDRSFEERVMRKIESEPKPGSIVHFPDNENKSKPKSKPVKAGKKKASTHKHIATIMALAASIAILVGLSMTDFFTEPTPTVPKLAQASHFKGKIEILRGKTKIPMRATTWLQAGDIISTANKSSVHVTYPQIHATKITSFLIKPNSSVKIEPNSHGKRLKLVQGAIHAKVAPQKDPMIVKTRNAVATILGTEFILSVKEEKTQLKVREGQVLLGSLNTSNETVVKTDEYASVYDKPETSERTDLVKGLLDDLKYSGTILGFYLISSNGNTEVNEPITDGSTVRLSQLPSSEFGIEAEAQNASGGSILFILRNQQGTQLGKFKSNLGMTYGTSAPDTNQQWTLTPGLYRLEATLYPRPECQGEKVESWSLSFKVVN